MLENVHFVEEAHYCPRAIVMSSVDSQGIPFRYYKGNIMTNDAEKSFHDLRMNGDDQVFIQLNFPNVPPHMNYIAVLEQNPHMPQQLVLTEYDRIMAETILDDSLYKYQQQKIYDEIDAALDAGDKELFLQLSNQLHLMQQIIEDDKEKKDGS